MKKRVSLVLLAGLALSARAAVPTMVTVPWAVNSTNLTDYSRTNTPTWWNGGTNFLGIVPGADYSLGVPSWMAWQAANYNFSQLRGFLDTNLVSFYGDARGTGSTAIAVTVNNVRGVLTNSISGGAGWATNTPAGQPIASKTDVTGTTNAVMVMVMAKGFLTTNSPLNAAKLVGTITASTAVTATNTPDGAAIPRLAGTNAWAGTNSFGAGKLLVDGVPVVGGAGGGGGSNGPLVISVSPSRIRGDESVTLKVSGSGFISDGMWIGANGISCGGTWVSENEIDVSITGGFLVDGLYDMSYHAVNGEFTLFGGLRVGPVDYATTAGSAGAIAITNKDVLFVSDRFVAFQTNFISVGAGINSLGLWLTNGFAGFDGQSLLGVYKVMQRVPDGDWSADTINTLVEIGLSTEISGMGTPAGLSNLVIYSWTQPAVYHRTNSIYGQYVVGDPPRLPHQVARRDWSLDMMNNAVKKGTNWSRLPAQAEIDTGTHPLRLSCEWEQTVTEGSATDTLSWAGNGSNVWSLAIPPAVSAPITYHSFEYDHASPMTSSAPYQVGFDYPKPTNTVYAPSNMMVVLPVAWTSAPPMVLWSSLVKPDKWITIPSVSTWPGTGKFVTTATNWNLDPNNGAAWPSPDAILGYQFITNSGVLVSFALPNKDLGNFKIATNTYTPPVGTLSGVLSMPPLTVTNSTSTTWGRGAGLICADTNYIYVSWGTNKWKRSALASW